MRLKRIEIAGFKSFRDKVVLNFSEGITAIVGPNGCGKSNVVDAIRWVLGEQRVKALRGKSMDDVIFNGSAESLPVGFAEVSMLLETSDQPFPGVYADLAELTIGRKIYRDGESEYSMNGAVCRLLDIKEFFMGTGVGTRTYSIIEQNSVFQLVEAKPEDRRQFIEEAAGISKYKSRKESALRKMETTQQNLQRIQDIIREVKGQLNAVSRQAKKAEQYKTLKKTIKDAEISLTLQSDSELAGIYGGKMRDREILAKQEETIRTELAGTHSKLEEIRLTISEVTDLLSKAQEDFYRVKNTVNVKEQGVTFLQGKVVDLCARKEKGQSDLGNLKIRIKDAAADLAVLQENLSEGKRLISEVENRLLEQQSQTDQAKTTNRTLQETLEAKRRQYYETMSEISKLRNLLMTLARGIEDVDRREGREKRELEEQQRRLADLGKTLEGLESETGEDEENLEALTGRKSRAIGELERNKEELRDIGESISELTETVSRKSARLASLQEFQKGYAWCNQAVKTIMTAKDERKDDGLRHDHFIGLIADHIDVPRDYETAVEAVLGEKLQYVVVKNQEDGVQAIDYLKNACQGRGSFVPMELRNHGNGVSHADHLQHAVRLIEKVGVEDEFRGIAEFLFGDVLMIPDLSHGIQLWQKNGFKGTFVTPDGDIIHPQGVLTGGRGERDEEMSLLRNKREMSELEGELSGLSRQLVEEKEMKKQLQRAILEWEEDLESLRAEMHRAAMQIQGRKKDIERFRADRDRIEQRIQALCFNIEQCAAERSRGETEREEARNNLVVQEQRESHLKEEMSELQCRWDDAKRELEAQEEALTKDRIDLASLTEKQDGDVRTLSRLDRDNQTLASEIGNKYKEIESAEAELAATELRILEEEKAVKALYHDQEVLEKALNTQQESLRGQESLLRGQEAEADKVKKQLGDVEKSLRELELELQEIHLNREHLRKNVEEKYQIDLETFRDTFQPLDKAEMAALGSRLKKDRENLDAFGEVNLLALTEYEEIKERYEFLSRQSADLITSLESLQKTIARINQISRQRFAETFNAVNECFRLVFAQVFQGGRGELILTDEKDLLETGVDIDIQIPGKKAQSISLLSGGEKTLAAIALIFALLLYRPTPFLILDEVDAALDDANVNLFNRLIKDVSLRSQVMMVTHNKRTMEVADSLFGVTMQKQGISNLISVNLN
jgi:chromosome segregation protein